mgnify:CR=1 FL=1
MKLNDDEGNIGIITEERMKEADEKIIAFTQIKRLNKIVDKLEQRIATLERVIAKKEQPKQLEFPFPELRANV